MKITATSVKVQSKMLLVLQKRNKMKISLIGTVRLMVPKMALLQNDGEIGEQPSQFVNG